MMLIQSNPVRAAGSAGSPQSAVSRRSPLLEGKRVLIVEDEGITQMQLRLILSRAGMVMAGSATNGEEAIKMAAESSPDIVLMDIKMPGAIDGLEAARRIMARQRTCVVMLTAYEEYAGEAVEAGAAGYVVKPVDSSTLLPQIEAAFQQFDHRQA